MHDSCELRSLQPNVDLRVRRHTAATHRKFTKLEYKWIQDKNSNCFARLMWRGARTVGETGGVKNYSLGNVT